MKSLKSLSFIFAIGCLLSQPARATNALFGYTHMQPSPLTLSAGQLVFGTDLALGVTDFFQVGTGLLRDFYQVYNANAKLSFYESDDIAFALTGAWQHFNYRDIYSSNPDLTVTTWQPGAVVGIAPVKELAWFVAGNLNFTRANLVTDGIQTSGFVRGAGLGSDLSWAYGSGKRSGGNALSTGVTYDMTYHILGVGLSHHWPGFHLGIHYYVNADRRALQPILAGGGSIQL